MACKFTNNLIARTNNEDIDIESVDVKFEFEKEKSLTIQMKFRRSTIKGYKMINFHSILIGILAGSYPALFMSALKPIETLKGIKTSSRSQFNLRDTLILMQFTATFVLLVGGLVIYQQMEYVRGKDLGYQKEHVLTIAVRDRALYEHYENLRADWLRNPDVTSVTHTEWLPSSINQRARITEWEGGEGSAALQVHWTQTDYDFIDVFGVELAAGRNFDRAIAGDVEDGYLINETAVQAFGWTLDSVIGKRFFHNGRDRKVIGVMKDFHLQSMHHAIGPLMINIGNSRPAYIALRIQPHDISKTLNTVLHSAEQISGLPLQYQFLDDRFDDLYREDIRLGTTFNFFALLTMIIAALGLFGLAAYTAETRKKEIGVRKVLGASTESIFILLNKKISLLVITSAVLAAPVALLVMQKWLEGFAYRVDIGAHVFILAVMISFFVTVLSVGYQTVKAALVNPVNSLRYE